VSDPCGTALDRISPRLGSVSRKTPMTISGVWLRTEGIGLNMNVVVLVEINGEWVRVITTHASGMEGEISHICEALGIREAMEKNNAD